MSLSGLSLRDLEYVVALADCLNFSRAAGRCAVSQPALSAQIRKLEAYLGATLFERQPGRAVVITAKGLEVALRARALLAQAHCLISEARDGSAPFAGPFRLGSIPTLGPYLLPYLLKPLRTEFPATRWVLSEGRTHTLLDELHTGRLDAVLACTVPPDTQFNAFTLCFEPFLLMHPPEWKVRWPLDAELANELDRENFFIVLAEGHCLRDQTLAACGCDTTRNSAARSQRHATGLDLLRHMVASGEGVSLMPALAAKALGPIAGLLAYTRIPDPDAGRETILITRRSDPRAAPIAYLADVLRGVCASLDLSSPVA